jgi:hypothetical protein
MSETVLIALGAILMTQTKVDDQAVLSTWRRHERVIPYLAERRARYASITRTHDGRLLILFTHQTEQQEAEGKGDLWLISQRDDQDWWFFPRLVHEGGDGEPRAMGTMTTLNSGRIIAPFAAMDHAAAASRIHLLSSDDGGRRWTASSSIAYEPLVWAAPYGKPVEIGGELIMPIYGAMSQEDLKETRLCAGLLRSSDGGETWSDWSTIAGPDERVSYEFPAVAALGDGTLLAVTTARQLRPRPNLPLDIPMSLVRSYSEDAGRSWSAPQHLCVGSWANLSPIDDSNLACTFALWSAWGSIELIVSDDGFRSIHDRSPVVEHAWLPGLSPAKWGTSWARDPIPLPPVVPYLSGDWSAGHFGFTSGLAVSDDELMVVLGQRQKGTPYTDPPSEVDIPIEKERIETIAFRRAAPKEQSRPRQHGRPDGQWFLADRMSVDDWRALVDEPPDGVSAVLKSGRWVRVQSASTKPHKSDGGRIIGRQRGYWIWKSIEGLDYATRLKCSYSDDQGKTWREAVIEKPVPLGAAVHPMGVVFEDSDGVLVAPVYGYLNHDDMSVSLYVSAIVRSHDDGESWGDWSVIAYDAEARAAAFSETTIATLPDGAWVAFLRTEYRSYVPFMRGAASRCVSTDQGRTWSPPEPCAAAGVFVSFVLPDGGIAVSGQNTCGWGLTISYDYGRSWEYALPATYVPTRGGVLDDRAFWLYDEHGGIVSIYRRN